MDDKDYHGVKRYWKIEDARAYICRLEDCREDLRVGC